MAFSLIYMLPIYTCRKDLKTFGHIFSDIPACAGNMLTTRAGTMFSVHLKV